jgi:thiamine-phosphate pyrophosphorylase
VTRPARPSLCLVTDRRRLAPDARTTQAELMALERAVDEAVAAGIDVVQIRERDLPTVALVDLVERVGRRTRPTATGLLVNDRADVARLAGADGVHLRADGPPERRVRAFGPPTWRLGRSIHAPAEAAAHPTADYLLFGTMFPSASKTAEAPVQTLTALAQAVEASAVPVWVIGGITVERLAACLAAGAVGVAAIGAFLDAPAPPGTVYRRVELMRQAAAAAFAVEYPFRYGYDPR